MKYALFFITATCLVLSAFLFGQESGTSGKGILASPAKNSDNKEPGQPNREDKHGPIDIVSDTKGVDMHPYLERVLPKIKANWYNRIPESARSGGKKGKVLIGFYLMKDGKISNVRYSETSGDIALDRAAYMGITDSSPLPPLPSEFACQFLALRVRFYYNLDEDEAAHQRTNLLVPCVTSKIRLAGEVGIVVSPSSVQVGTGAKQQFLATFLGDVGSAVTWSVGGRDCLASSCGDITGDGLYTAPNRIPNPATITVTATLASAPSETASAAVTIVQSSPSR